jgi:hypothetical protein
MAGDEDRILEEALDNPREASERLTATRNRTLAWPGLGMPDRPPTTATPSFGRARPWR